MSSIKIILLVALGVIFGLFVSYILFKKLSLTAIARIHGLHSVVLPSGIKVINGIGSGRTGFIPSETVIYVSKYPPESLTQYIVFINIEDPDLKTTDTDVISPLTAFEADK